MNRVRIDEDGVAVSVAGEPIETAGYENLNFSSAFRSLPVLIRTGAVAVNASMGAVTSLYYGKTFSSPPLSQVFWSPTLPTGSSLFGAFSGLLGNTDKLLMWDYATNTGGYVAGSVTIEIRRLVDRIDIVSVLAGSTAIQLHPLSGYVAAVVYDYE